MKDDTISRAAAIEAFAPYAEYESNRTNAEWVRRVNMVLSALPPAQPNLSEAYSKAVFTWLMEYQIRAAELKGKYTPYEVLSWVINDWRKENG